MPNAFASIGFMPHVREEQKRFGSAGAYARLLSPDRLDGGELTAREAEFLSARDGIYQATVSETGWSYVQFRGGAPGFIKVIDQRAIGYADFRGNQQFISLGNLRHDDRVPIIALDCPRRKRLKLWGHARIVEAPEVIGLLHDGTGPKVERGIVIRVAAFNWNCPQHIPIRRTDAERDDEITQLRTRIKTLESRLNETAGVTQEAELPE